MRVKGVGPLPCEFCVVGSGPGWEEDKSGRAFVGKTGKELARFLDGSSLPHRDVVFLTNLYRQYGGKGYQYTAADLERDEPDLLEELQACTPKIIIPLGRDATRWFLGDVDLDAVQGLPFYLPPQDKLAFLGKETVIFAITHPAAAFHSPELSTHVVAGFNELSAFLDGDIEPRILFNDPYPEPVYKLLEGDHVWEVLKAL